MSETCRRPLPRRRAARPIVAGVAIGIGVGHVVLLLVLNQGERPEAPSTPPEPRATPPGVFVRFQAPTPPRRRVKQRPPTRRIANPGLSRSAPAAPPPAEEPSPASDYGRWTVRGGAAPGEQAGHGLDGCAPAALPALSEAKRQACVKLLKAAAEREGDSVAGRGPQRDWRDRRPVPCSKAFTRRLSLTLCSGLGISYRF